MTLINKYTIIGTSKVQHKKSNAYFQTRSYPLNNQYDKELLFYILLYKVFISK